MEDKYKLSIEQNLFLAKKVLVANVYSNAKMEGCNVTFPQTQTILDGVNVPSVRLEEIQCILNLRDAWKYVISNIQEEFTIEFASKVNEYVARNESIEWGCLRTGKVGISGTDYVPEIPNRAKVIENMHEIEKIQTITQRAISYMLYAMRSQLFWDGNKRTSIICANKILISQGKGIFTIKDEHLNEFNRLLTQFYNTNDEKEIAKFSYDHCIYGIDTE